VSQRLFEVRDLRIAVNDQDAAVRGEIEPPVSDRGEPLAQGWVEAIPGLSYGVDSGEVLALVGESASGKTLGLLGAFALLPNGARALGGTTSFDGTVFRPGGKPFGARKPKRKELRAARDAGRTVADLGDEEWARVMGTEIGFLFQNPLAAWTPDIVIGDQTGEVLEEHSDLSREEIEQRVYDALGSVQLPKSSRLFGAFRHELSRGMGQRAMLAAALIKAPRLLIADEPLTGLDAPVASAILDLIKDMQTQRGMAMILVTHDLGVVARVADRVAVMYGGVIVEEGPISDLYHKPTHPYTSALLGAVPGVSAGRLRTIGGEAPRLSEIERDRCVFVDRCTYAIDTCFRSEPSLEPIHQSQCACHRKYNLDLPGVGR
jgi:oligopeptide/dipeptide ABC transporter ATP-binding protein